MKNKFLYLFLFAGILSGCEKEIATDERTTGISKNDATKFFFLEKGDTVPKNVYRDKPITEKIETKIVTSENLKADPVKSTFQLTSYVTDLYIIVGNNSMIQPPALYNKIWVDLNEGAGGKFIYLCYTKYDFAQPLGGIEIYSGRERIPYPEIRDPWKDGVVTNSAGFDYPGIDLNWGSGGNYIYLYQTRKTGILNPYEGYLPWGKIKEIGVYSSNSSSSSQVPYGWKRIPIDLNKGAGGKFIYIIYKTE